jgi:hypothetical protein
MAKTSFQQLAYFLDTLRRLRKYVEFSEKNWEEKLAAYNASLGNDHLNLKSFGGERGLWSDLAREFPQYQRKACFLMIFAMLEDDLNQFCESIRLQLDLKLNLSDIAGRGIERAKIYLLKVVEIRFPSQSVEWEKIQHYRDLRNILIHEAGYLDEEKAQHLRIKEFSEQKDSGLSVERHARNRINLEPEFLPRVLDTLENFYELLIEETKGIRK